LVSPARTSRRYWLSRSFNSRTSTLSSRQCRYVRLHCQVSARSATVTSQNRCAAYTARAASLRPC
jgi:hypothetical protein